jgi:hypothetical protein
MPGCSTGFRTLALAAAMRLRCMKYHASQAARGHASGRLSRRADRCPRHPLVRQGRPNRPHFQRDDFRLRTARLYRTAERVWVLHDPYPPSLVTAASAPTNQCRGLRTYLGPSRPGWQPFLHMTGWVANNWPPLSIHVFRLMAAGFGLTHVRPRDADPDLPRRGSAVGWWRSSRARHTRRQNPYSARWDGLCG